MEAMALAVENADVMLIGVSRQYKESTNCRLEAQYAMQREVPTIPLMLADGYRADGWLGMLIGTRMWYGFFGAVLTEESLFDSKVSELCRDIGLRGRAEAGSCEAGADVSLVSSSNDAGVGAAGDEEDGTAALRSELSALKLMELRQRAIRFGVGSDVVEDALDHDQPRIALVELLIEHQKEAGAAAGVRWDLEKGGEEALAAMRACLEHAVEVLDGLSMSLARKDRKSTLELLDRVETVSQEVVDARWCDGLAQCGDAAMEKLASSVVAVMGLAETSSFEAARVAVTGLLECVDCCARHWQC